MLHEILLSLSGQPSPLLADPVEIKNDSCQDAFPLLSPPEKALLAPLARLSRLHAMLRKHVSDISASHPSPACRAVSTAIYSEHLSSFQRKILEVENSILKEDSKYVGGYGIVPLSTIVGEFSPWTRRMEWLWEIVQFVLSGSKERCNGAMIIDHLRAELRTGYSDLEEMALQLLKAAEVAWLKQLSMWLLYGKLPLFGKEDCFVQEGHVSGGVAQFHIKADLLPKFVPPATAASILFIGKSLNHVRGRSESLQLHPSGGSSISAVTLNREHIEQLSSLQVPISSSALANVVNAMRQSLSQTTLSKLLPVPKILQTLSLLHNFALLGRSEFVMALVKHADARVISRKYGRQENVSSFGFKEGDIIAVLAQTWSELSSLQAQNEESPVDDELDLARAIVRLSIAKKQGNHTMAFSQDTVDGMPSADISKVVFNDLLFPVPTALSIELQPPLDLFLSMSDIAIYSTMHAYLLGIRRAYILLSGLWKHTFLRKNHPAPWGPPRSNTTFGQSRLRASRLRDNSRTARMRTIWATSSAAIFVLSEIGSYFQAEVITESWRCFRDWITGSSSFGVPGTPSRPGSAKDSRDVHHEASLSSGVSRSEPEIIQQHDPEMLTIAHRRHLFALLHSLLLTEVPFTAALRSLLTSIDRFVALVTRLEGIQKNMDLETDEGVVDALADYSREEKEVWTELCNAHIEVEEGMKDVVARLRDIDDNHSGRESKVLSAYSASDPHSHGLDWYRDGIHANPHTCAYVPRQVTGIDRLLMKLDSGSLSNDLGFDTSEDME